MRPPFLKVEKKTAACSKGGVKEPGTPLLIKFIKFILRKSQHFCDTDWTSVLR